MYFINYTSVVYPQNIPQPLTNQHANNHQSYINDILSFLKHPNTWVKNDVILYQVKYK